MRMAARNGTVMHRATIDSAYSSGKQVGDIHRRSAGENEERGDLGKEDRRMYLHHRGSQLGRTRNHPAIAR